ncbi:trypsin-like peptidase domain-containing protein, partial [bacterium]|nr:trypsin-like peptidase domain-containing protein [bacterium]
RFAAPVPSRLGCPRCKYVFAPGADLPPAEDLPSAEDRPAPPSRVVPILLGVGIVGLLLAAGGGVAAWALLRTPQADEPDAPAAAAPAAAAPAVSAPTRFTPEDINRRLLQSAVFVVRADAGATGLGRGALVHAPRRLVLTNHHVVGSAQVVGVFFPDYDAKRELVTDPKHYATNARRLAVKATVLARDSRRDLAVLELEKLPTGVAGLPLADRPAATGAAVYSVGASGVGRDEGGAFWRFSAGTVRGRHHDTFRIQTGQSISAMILETQKPVNPGDSGGPTVNDRGELVGVVSSGSRVQNLVMNDIDLTEVRAFLGGVAKDRGWAWRDADAAPPSSLGPRPSDPDSPPVPPAVDAKTDLLAKAKSPDAAVRVDALRQVGALKTEARWAVPALVAALDDPDDRVRRMAATALDAVGLPTPEDAGCLVAALTGQRFARLHALRHFGAAEKAGRDTLPAVVAALDADDPDTREAAARAVGFYGADAKSVALPRLLAHATDPDPGVARAVARVLDAFGPYGGADRTRLDAALAGRDPNLRCVAVRLIAPAVADADAAVGLFRPLLGDAAAPVRELAARGLGK